MSNSDNKRVTATATSFINRRNTNYSESQKKINMEATKMKLKDNRKRESDCVEVGIALPVAQFHKTSDGKIKANQVLERLPLGHTRTQFIRLHLDLAAFLFQYPHISGVPLLDLVTVTASHDAKHDTRGDACVGERRVSRNKRRGLFGCVF